LNEKRVLGKEVLRPNLFHTHMSHTFYIEDDFIIYMVYIAILTWQVFI